MEELQELIEDKLGIAGRMISMSKTAYRMKYPDNKAVFNANIVSKHGKLWYGDIDLTLDSGKLQEISNESKETICVLMEMDARFGTENLPFDTLKEKAVLTFNPN